MNVHVSYKAGKTPDVEREIQNQLQKIQRRLKFFKPDLVGFHAILEQQNGQSASASLNLRLPSGQLAVQKSGENFVVAVKAAFAELLAQLNRHKEMLRHEWSWKSRRTPGRGAAAEPAVPLGETSASATLQGASQAAAAGAETPFQDQVQGWIGANLPVLESYIDRELLYRISNGQIQEGQISRQEVIDETIVSALSQENGSGHLLGMESWFHRLAAQAIRRLSQTNSGMADVSLDAPAGVQNVTGSDENVLQYHQPDDTVREENVIRDQTVSTPEEIFANEEMVAQLDMVLREVPAKSREAFVLYTLEGFTVEEISRLLDRPPAKIRSSIEEARVRVQQHLPGPNSLKQVLLGRSRVA